MISVIYLLPLKFLAKNWFCFETSPEPWGWFTSVVRIGRLLWNTANVRNMESVVVITVGTSTPTGSYLMHRDNQKILVIV